MAFKKPIVLSSGQRNQLQKADSLAVIASVAPAVTDDIYSLGTHWIDTVTQKEYVIIDNTVGAAVWIDVTATGGSPTIASQAEAEAGTDNTKMMTPLRAAQSIYVNSKNGVSNAKFIADGTNILFSLARIDSTKPIVCSCQSPIDGLMKDFLINSDLTINLSIDTVTGTVANLTSTYHDVTNNQPIVSLFAYLVLENVSGTITPYLGLSRNPNLTIVPNAYFHTNGASTRTEVGSASTTWNAMWISKNGAINTSSTTCICLGEIGQADFHASDGTTVTVTSSAFNQPKWKDKSSSLQQHTPQFDGFSANPGASGAIVYYKIEGNLMYWEYVGDNVPLGTSNATNFRIALPLSPQAVSGVFPVAIDSGSSFANAGYALISSPWLTILKGGSATGWTASGDKDLSLMNSVIFGI